MMEPPQSRKKTDDVVLHRILLVGDSRVGKTSFLMRYRGEIPDPSEYAYVPFVLKGPVKSEVTLSSGSKVGNNAVTVLLNEMPPPGCEPGSAMLQFCYDNVSIVIICFSLGDPDSLSSVEEKWAPEVKHNMKERGKVEQALFILVGCKKDLRGVENSGEVPTGKPGDALDAMQGARLSQRIGAAKYMECSAITGEGVTEVVYEATRLSRTVRTRRNLHGCTMC